MYEYFVRYYTLEGDIDYRYVKADNEEQAIQSIKDDVWNYSHHFYIEQI